MKREDPSPSHFRLMFDTTRHIALGSGSILAHGTISFLRVCPLPFISFQFVPGKCKCLKWKMCSS